MIKSRRSANHQHIGENILKNRFTSLSLCRTSVLRGENPVKCEGEGFTKDMRKFPLHNDTIKGSNVTRMPHNVEGGNRNGVNLHACRVHRGNKRYGKGLRKLSLN